MSEFTDHVAALKSALTDSRDRSFSIAQLKSDNSLLEIQISGLKAVLELANEKCAECDRQSRINDELADGGKIADRDRTIAKLNTDAIDSASVIAELDDKLDDRDRTIAILEENLARAEANHLEQLKAIVQMLEPLATHEDKGSLYLSHFGKAAMVYMIQQVIYANINKLDPEPCTYSDDL